VRRTVRGATVINSRATRRRRHDASALAARVHRDIRARSGSGDGDGGGSGGGGGGDSNGSLSVHAPHLVPGTTMILGHGSPT